MTKILNAEVTKRGFISLWEEGGGCCNTGNSVIIAKANGEKPVAVYVPRGGHLSNGQHALIPVHENYFVIDASHARGDFEISIYQVKRLIKEKDGEKVAVEVVNRFDQGEWDNDVPDFLEPAVLAAKNKARDYHCRSVYYALTKK